MKYSDDKKTYDEIVNKSPTKHQYIYSDETLMFLDKILPKGKILDIGCGTGHYAEMLKNRKWYGVDISPKSIEIAKKFYIEAKVGDITNSIPFPDNSFNYVLCLSILHHVPNFVSEVLDEIKRVLKPNGMIIIIDHDNRDTHTRLIHSGPLKLVPCENERALDVVDITKTLTEKKFSIDELKEIHTEADQQALKFHLIKRIIKVMLLKIFDIFGRKTKGDFLIKAKLRG